MAGIASPIVPYFTLSHKTKGLFYSSSAAAHQLDRIDFKYLNNGR